MYQLWTEQLIRNVEPEGFINILLPSLCSLVDLSETKTLDLKDNLLFHQMWLVIFGFLHSKSFFSKPLPPIVSGLAKRTPSLVYMSDFSLMLRLGNNKEVIEGFIDLVFQRYPTIYDMP